MGGSNFFCSAQVVRSRSHTLVLTAGHCVHGADVGQGFATNFMFAPGFKDGTRPFGTWTASKLLTTPEWASNANLRFDLGAAIMRRNANGGGVQDVVGARGIAFDQPRQQTYHAFGYPVQSPFDGRRLQRCVSGLARSDSPPGSGPQTMGIDCDMTGGSSGGGWVVRNHVVSSVISYGYECTGFGLIIPCNNPDADRLFGPYFGSAIKTFYRRARGSRIVCAGAEATNVGGSGRDKFEGSAGPNVFKLRGGADSAFGGGRRDRLCGGRGGDRLRGGRGRDVLRGGPGPDVLRGGPGRDVCIGGPGRDRAVGCEKVRRARSTGR
jgi:V8-like Glu-specific endopeptidase